MSKKATSKPSPANQRANDLNPNNAGFKASLDNRSVQLNSHSSGNKPPAKIEVKKS